MPTSVGVAQSGQVTLLDKATITSKEGIVGELSNSVGRVVVKDSGSKWIHEGEYTIGNYGKGTVEVSNGGIIKVDSNHLYIGRKPDSEGILVVSGS